MSHQRQSLSSHFSYILLRLCALVGVLFILERFGLQLWDAYFTKAPVSPSPFYDPRAIFKDGRLFDSSAPIPQTRKSKAIVAAAVRDDNTTWLQQYFSDWEVNIYVMNDPDAEMTVFKNKGNEGSAYLSYIISHFHALPDTIVFLHAQRYQWHNDDPMYDHVPPLSHLRTSHVSRLGYTNLRCNWKPGCPHELEPNKDFEDGIFGIRSAYANAFSDIFPHEPIPDLVSHQCCAQFAVSRDKIREKPVRYYEKIRQWMWETELHPGRSGRILEYMWHIIFSMPSVHCPTAHDCYCLTYGLCNLTCPTDASCNGRWANPPFDTRIPKDWPAEGQGQNGWPEIGWWKHRDN